MDHIPQREKELIIKLKVNQLRKLTYYFILFLLLSVIIFQFFYPNCNKCCLDNMTKEEGSTITEVAPKEKISKTIVPEAVPINNKSEEVIIEVNNSTDEMIVEVNDSVEEEVNESVEEGPLSITGDVSLMIDEINYVIKGDDYARVTSVTFTIKNQDVDFDPKLRAYLTSDQDDMKDATLSTIEAGEIYTETNTKLTFGYKDINDTHTLKLQLYKGNKLLKTATKVFETN